MNAGKAFPSFSVDNLEAAREFYGKTLGIATESPMDQLELRFPSGMRIFVYEKPDHEPASFTVLNFAVDNVDKAVDELRALGVEFEQYHDNGLDTDAKGIQRGEPTIAWFKDPAGNILSVLSEA